MHFVALCDDKDGALDIRKANRDAHLAFIAGLDGAIAIAGPFLNEAGDMVGSMLIVEAEDLAAAKALLADDPYAKAGLFAAVTIRPWKWAVGADKA